MNFLRKYRFTVQMAAVAVVALLAMLFQTPEALMPLAAIGAVLTESNHAGEFLLSEANGNQSRENVILLSGQVVVAGQVLGISGGKYSAYNQAGGGGLATAVAIAWDNYDATDGDMKIAVIARDAEVISEELEWGGQSPTDVAAGVVELALKGIIVRRHATEV